MGAAALRPKKYRPQGGGSGYKKKADPDKQGVHAN
jgi:hypothetical protein